MSNGEPKKEQPGQRKESELNAPAPGKEEPGKETPPGGKPPEPKPGEAPPGEPPKGEDIFSQKLEGDDVPEKLRGKTIAEALTIVKGLEGELTKSGQEIATWHKYYEAVKTREEAGEKPEETKPDFLKHFDEDQAGAIVTLVDQYMKPVFDAVGGMQLSYVKASRPDFEAHEERARKIYENFPLAYKLHPDYGWDFAYRFAKAEKEGGPPPTGPGIPHAGPSADAVPLKKEEAPLT
ncbi:MAG: hypothetical protein NWE76_05180, partial [Candidatus Bathyarchaeota archaeon]|nr:hypothetical protein [Candidatus Bathyarchaeota archaeon]